MDISGDKQILTLECLNRTETEKPLEIDWISSDSSAEQRHKDQLFQRIN